MSPLVRPGYHFVSKAQWDQCLQSGADRKHEDSIVPFSSFPAPTEPTYPSDGAFAPCWTRESELLWRDRRGEVHRLPYAGETPTLVSATPAIAGARRIVATRDGLWVKGQTAGTLACFEQTSLSRRFVVEIPGSRVIDIAGGGRDGILALVSRNRAWSVVPIDCVGRTGQEVALEGIPEPRMLTSTSGNDLIVVLARDGKHVFGFAKTGGNPTVRIASATLGSCFVGLQLAAGQGERVFVGGMDEHPRKPHIAILDRLGAKVDDIDLPESATGIAVTRDSLLVTGSRGLYRLAAGDRVPESTGEVAATVVAPMLEAPEREDGRRWLRIEAEARLPEGTTLEVSYAATDDPEARDELRRVEQDNSIPAPRRARLVRQTGDLWSVPIAFHGRDTSANSGAAIYAVPLHDVRGKYVWVSLSLVASGGSALPEITRLSVLYPGQTLMQQLPMIYQREEAQPESLTRALVGLLETTTQDLDSRIAGLGENIHPTSATVTWLNYVARWLGLPWDDALDVRQKRCIVQNAERIATARGTRAGLEVLLGCLVGGTPRRFRVVDSTVDYGLARLGGGGCSGTALPAILSGLPATAALLGVQATLGKMRLPCEGEDRFDTTSRFLGQLRVDVAAIAAEREKWEPWLSRLVTEMLPLGTRATVRWTTARQLRGDRLDDDLTLEADPLARLGTDAVTGLARLPSAPTWLSSSGAGDPPILE